MPGHTKHTSTSYKARKLVNEVACNFDNTLAAYKDVMISRIPEGEFSIRLLLLARKKCPYVCTLCRPTSK